MTIHPAYLFQNLNAIQSQNHIFFLLKYKIFTHTINQKFILLIWLIQNFVIQFSYLINHFKINNRDSHFTNSVLRLGKFIKVHAKRDREWAEALPNWYFIYPYNIVEFSIFYIISYTKTNSTSAPSDRKWLVDGGSIIK